VNVLTVVGARPQFVKCAPVSRALRARGREVLVHTGQHYDDNLSAVFFRELRIPDPDHQLGVGSGPHGAQTGEMLRRLEPVVAAERPDCVIVYGDTNSTLAGALVAAKLGVPVAHVEAGLRSSVRSMPEEINRVLTDRVSELLLCPTEAAVANLAREGMTRGVHLVGDVMADTLLEHAEIARRGSSILDRLGLRPRAYHLATVHRAENTDDPGRLRALVTALAALDRPVLWPAHPRVRAALARLDITPDGARLRLIDPVSYLDMLRLELEARAILTDSGGVQKEAYWMSVPCLTLRDETEWVETLRGRANVLVGADPARIAAAIADLPETLPPVAAADGQAAWRVAELVERLCVSRAPGERVAVAG